MGKGVATRAASSKEGARKHALKPPNKPKVTAQVTASSKDLDAQIRTRANELYEQRGREDGHELDDWLEAEAELVRQKAKVAGA